MTLKERIEDKIFSLKCALEIERIIIAGLQENEDFVFKIKKK